MMVSPGQERRPGLPTPGTYVSQEFPTHGRNYHHLYKLKRVSDKPTRVREPESIAKPGVGRGSGLLLGANFLFPHQNPSVMTPQPPPEQGEALQHQCVSRPLSLEEVMEKGLM